MVKKQLTEADIAQINKAIAYSEESKSILDSKIEHLNFMLNKGLDMNYKEKKRELEQNLSKLKYDFEFEVKFIDTYNKILSAGEIEEDETKQEEQKD